MTKKAKKNKKMKVWPMNRGQFHLGTTGVSTWKAVKMRGEDGLDD
jgi:hypothetical protein